MLKRKITSILLCVFVLISFGTGASALTATQAVSMSSMFEKPSGNYYNYAPCVIQIDSTTKYVYYCGNQQSDQIVDSVCWRKGTLQNGEWEWTNEHVAFEPSQTGWDCCHVCDPDLVKGTFSYNGHTYTWAMTYLGVAQWDCNANQIGLAFSDSIEGPWIRFGQSPIISAANTTSWGVGQDSMISLDNLGKFRVIYRYSDGVGDYCRYKDFDFLNADSYSESVAHTVSRVGLTDGISETCSSHVALDPVRNIYYMAAERVWDEQKRSCRETLIATMSASDFEAGTGSWITIYRYNEADTGYASNHNSSMERDSYGKILNPDLITVAMSSSDVSGLWSFRLNEGILSVTDSDLSSFFETGHAYKLVNKATGLVLDNWNSENGSACYNYEWTGVYNQQWVFTSLGQNNYKLCNRWTAKVLQSPADGLSSEPCISDDVSSLNQHWEITKSGSNSYKLINLYSGYALTGGEATNGSPITSTEYNGSDNQSWEIVDCGPAEQSAVSIQSGSAYKLVNKSTGDVLDCWNSDNGSNCYSYTWTGVDNQKWTLTTCDAASGTYKIINNWTGNALDCYDLTNGATAYTWAYVNGTDQQWQLEPLDNGCYKIINCKNGKSLTQSIQGNGNSIFCWDYIGNETQMWEIIEV